MPEEDQGARSMNTIRKMDISKRRRRKKYGSYGDNLDAILQICIKSMRNSYKECLESDLSDLLDYVVFQVEYDREKVDIRSVINGWCKSQSRGE